MIARSSSYAHANTKETPSPSCINKIRKIYENLLNKKIYPQVGIPNPFSGWFKFCLRRTAPPCCSPCCCPSVCAAGQKGAPILFRACARRAAGDGVCRGSAVAAGRPPGGPPEAMVSPEHHHSGIDVENKLYTYYRRTRNAILCLNKL